MNRVWGFFLLFLIACPLLQAEETWEGNAAVIRKGEFDSPGLFAASNSFPAGSLIRVENPQNGKQVEVTVARRIEGPANVFLLLSEEASAQLGLAPKEVIRVRAQILSTGEVASAQGPGELPYSPDPEINPASGVPAAAVEAPAAKEEALLPEEPAAPPQPEVTAVAAAETPASEEKEEVKAEETPKAEQPGEAKPAVTLEQAPKEEPAPQAKLTPEEKRLQEISSRAPQKQLFMPPREDERFVLIPPTAEVAKAGEQPPAATLAPPAQEKKGSLAELPPPRPAAQEETAATLDRGAPAAARRESVALLQPQSPEPPAAEAKGQEKSLERASPPDKGTVSLAPAEPQPPPPESPREPVAPQKITPAAKPEKPAVAEVKQPVKAAAPLAPGLSGRTVFLQLGAYSSRGLADKLARELEGTYAVAVLPASAKNRTVYKVLIGPLNQDESGTLLYQFRSKGFKDAFLTRAE